MNRIHRSIRVLAALFAGVAVALAAAAPAALATPTPPPGQLPRFLPCSPMCANGLHTVTRRTSMPPPRAACPAGRSP
jgi:hypothetical protein